MLLSICFLLLCATDGVAGVPNEATMAALVATVEAIPALGTLDSNPWNSSAAEELCLWSGVTCGDDSVTALHLPTATLIGTLPAAIFELGSLISFHSGCNLISMPSSFNSSLSNLKQLKLCSPASTTDFEPISESICGFSRLETLDLSGGGWNGAGTPVSVLLSFLFLTLVRLSVVPTCFGLFARLEWLSLASNDLETSLPDTMAGLSSLRYIDMSNNRFDTFPDVVCTWRNLTFMRIDANPLTGSLPECLSDLGKLQAIRISASVSFPEARMTGTIPSLIASAATLSSLSIASQAFSGGLPEWIGSLRALTSLSMSDVGFGGEIPDSFRDLVRLERLTLNNCDLSGEIPLFLSEMPDLQVLSLGSNNLSGSWAALTPISLLIISTRRHHS